MKIIANYKILVKTSRTFDAFRSFHLLIRSTKPNLRGDMNV